jgi:diguanylate cyclase (GGDEF)-like protein/PAS domain S-box-containing protein
MPAFSDPEIYRNILESLPTGLSVINMEKKIVLWSDGAERITGYSRHEVVGHNCAGEALPHCNQPDCEWCNADSPLWRAIKTSRPTEAFGFLHHKSGHEVAVLTRAVPVRDNRGLIVGAVEAFEEQQQAGGLDDREDREDLPACVDPITSVANQTMMRSHLRERLGRFAEMQVPFALLLLRLEGLNEFRSRCGADASSQLLRMIARTLEGALWRTDFVGRWSDDQFLVILNSCREDALRSVRERIRRMVAGDAIEWWGERRSLPVSIGEATVQDDDSIESMIERAQKSLDASPTTRAHAAAAAGGNPPPRS